MHFMTTKLYGIPNCDTVKKARNWLAENGIEYKFVDFKKSPPSHELIKEWLKAVPLEILLNKRGTTWRKLTDEEKAGAENQGVAVELMVQQPSTIKRPVLVHNGRYVCGFTADVYEDVFKS
ncbi:arsenate reductase [Neisseria wadsworthii]|uniref:ArsC family protein n=1 Tax=Neisseria wadsworthii 9715 TaxID=1030841 RepID=G4CQB8_9NEIS|nr:arsenate reductase [Neisseria wadsworthii]EGZ46523.1 ArsC family protein [Neisseria wadsworthii 9715]